MMRDFFLWLLTSLVVDPMQAEWSARLGAAGAPPPVVAGLTRCAGEAAPALASRAAGCAAAVETARSFLARPPS